MSSQKGLQVVSSRFTSTKSKFKKIPTIFIVLIPAILSLLLIYLSMKNFSVNDNNNNNNSLAATMTTKPSLINSASNNSSKSQPKPKPKEQIIETGATTTTTTATAATTTTINIPSCDQSPWKLSENLIGSCPSGLKPYKSASASALSVQECATDCCHSDKCITWQYRPDVGCLHGGDIRLGMEKDGPSSWCSEIQPKRWQGQYVLKRANGQIIKTKDETGSCDVETWNPKEQPGQCFGLGDVKMTIDETKNKDGSSRLIKSAQDCMVACCNSKKLHGECGAWQYHDELGCYYHKRMHGCVDTSNPIVFEPFVGRRKQLSTRTYTDKRGNPWTQQQQQQQQQQ